MPTERSMPPDIITMVIDDRDDARHGDLLKNVHDVDRTDEGRILRPAASRSAAATTMIATKLAKIDSTVRFSCRLKSDSLTCNVAFEVFRLVHSF